jgi:hypothetical protein
MTAWRAACAAAEHREQTHHTMIRVSKESAECPCGWEYEENDMRVLCLDLATKTGWALFDGERVESGVQNFSLERGDSPGMRYLKFNRWLAETCLFAGDTISKPPELIVYEACHNRGGAATEVANGLTTRVQEFCALHHIDHTSVHTSTLKKHATGSGTASKDQMINAAIKRWGIIPADDNEADALCIAHWALDGCPQPSKAKKKATL